MTGKMTKELIDRIFKEPGIKYELSEFETLGIFPVPISTLNARALEGLDLTSKQVDLTKNFFALGVMFWLYERSMEPTIAWIDDPFAGRPILAEANKPRPEGRLRVRRDHGDLPPHSTGCRSANLPPGTYRNITGNEATALGLRGRLAPARARPVLRHLPDHAGQRHPPPALDLQVFGVRTFQAEDEIAAMGAAIGAAYGGALP